MKILFAVSNENVSDAIVKSYQKNYNDSITYKNVFYFNAIIKEIQRDKEYDRIIISEDLEPFANNNYDAIDKFIFERLDAIVSEIKYFAEKRIPIILICTDRRTKTSPMITKIFNIGIYDAVIGSDRKIENVCRLIKEPRTKEDAKQYYKIESGDENNSSEVDISEEEVQNIVNYYKKLGKNEERYTDSFNNIATQYTDAQLKIIIRYLPINVKAILESECAKYQELVTFDNPATVKEQKEKERLRRKKQREKEEEEERIREQLAQKKKREQIEKKKQANKYIPNNSKNNNQSENKTRVATGIGILDNKINRPSMQGNVVIPNAINTKQAKKVLSDDEMNIQPRKVINNENKTENVVKPKVVNNEQVVENREIKKPVENSKEKIQTVSLPGFENIETDNIQVNVSNDIEEVDIIPEEVVVKEKKEDNPINTVKTPENDNNIEKDIEVEPVKRGRGRPRKTPLPEENKIPMVQEVKTDNNIKTVEDNSNDVNIISNLEVEPTKRGRGRPRITPIEEVVEKTKGKRGRPRKTPLPEDNISMVKDIEIDKDIKTTENNSNSIDNAINNLEVEPVKRGRGRPRITPIGEVVEKPKGKRGRPRKTPLPEENNKLQVEEVGKDNFIDIEEVPKKVNNESDNQVSNILPEVEKDDITSTFSSFDAFEVPEGKTEETTSSTILPGFDEDFEELDKIINNDKQEDTIENQNYNVLDDNFDNIDDDNEDIQDDISVEDEQSEETSTLPGMMDIEDFEDEDNVEEDNINENLEEQSEEDIDSYTKQDDLQDLNDLNNGVTSSNNVVNSLPGFEDLDDMVEDEEESNISQEEGSLLPGFENDEINSSVVAATSYRESDLERTASIRKLEENRVYSTGSLQSALTPDKKIVAFIGTSKNGTSFIVNNLASLFSSIGIKTAILDMTKNRNAYYIYTNNDEKLRQVSYDAIDKLENGVAEGIKSDRNLDVYTAVPNEEKDFSNAEAILTTLIKNESLVLIDCDYDTPLGYFANAQEIYLVQSMDILTIQPLTAFLRELKANGILDQEKLRVVVNKEIKVRGLTSKTIIGGMSFYNDPSMSYMTELFNKDKIKACTLPFEDAIYSKYLETLVNCNVSISGYSKNFMNSLKILGNMVYPLLSKQTYVKNGPDYTKSNFSTEMNNTLNQMRKKY